MSRKKNLSFCVITYNDEQDIEKSLLSIKDFVDEIIVVDIGSEDLTICKAEQIGAKIYQFKWNYDFSEVKNFCLDKAKGRWVLFLQANELILKEEFENIHLLLDNSNIEGYLLDIDYNFEKHRIHSPVQSLRLFRNRKEYRFKHRVFERIPDEILRNVRESGIHILQQSNHNLASKFDIFIKLLEEDTNNHFEDSYLQYIYGIELLNQKRYRESIVCLEISRKNLNYDYLFAPHLFKCLSWALITINEYHKALDVLEEGIKAFPLYTDLFVLRGEIRKQLKQYDEAIKDLEISIKTMKQSHLMVPKPEVDISVIFEELGDIHGSLFNYQRASVYYQQAYKINHKNRELLYKIGKLAKRISSIDLLDNILKAAIEERDIEKLVTIMDIFFQKREYKRVLELVEYLENLIGKGEESESIKFTCHLMLGDLGKAMFYFTAINRDSSFYNHALLKLVEKYWSNSQWQEAKQLILEMTKIENIRMETKRLYITLHQLLAQGESDYILTTAQEYEIVNSLMESFLWLRQQDKAQLLLPLILKEREEEQYINIAEVWAEINDYKTLENIFYFISNKQKQKEFKQKIIVSLLNNGYIETAEKIINLGNFQSLEGLEHLVWAKNFINKIAQWINSIIKMNTNYYDLNIFEAQVSSKPSKDLIELYYSLGLDDNNPDKDTYVSKAENLTIVKIYEDIGDFFLRTSKYKEALTAYLNIIINDPLNQEAIEKLVDILKINFNEYLNFIEKKYLFIEGFYFERRQDFLNYTVGCIYFKNNKIEEALKYFLKIGEDMPIYMIALAYIISSFMILGEEEKAVVYLSEKNRMPYIFKLILQICKNHALNILNKECNESLYNELFEQGRQKILDKAILLF